MACVTCASGMKAASCPICCKWVSPSPDMQRSHSLAIWRTVSLSCEKAKRVVSSGVIHSKWLSGSTSSACLCAGTAKPLCPKVYSQTACLLVCTSPPSGCAAYPAHASRFVSLNNHVPVPTCMSVSQHPAARCSCAHNWRKQNA